ncbi:unnamed protein product [Ixodes pacificus]
MSNRTQPEQEKPADEKLCVAGVRTSQRSGLNLSSPSNVRGFYGTGKKLGW